MLHTALSIFFGLMAINAIPAAMALLLGGIRWATTLALTAALLAAIVVGSAAILAAIIPPAADLILHMQISPAWRDGVFFALAATMQVALVEFICRRHKAEFAATATAGPLSAPRRSNLIVRLHDSIHGPK